MSIQNKVGRVNISSHFIQNMSEQEFVALFSNFYPVRINENGQTFEYYGFSPLFDEIKDSEPVPTYDFLFERKDDGTIFLKEAVKWQP